MGACQNLHHTQWNCKYHLVWIPKYRGDRLYGPLRKELGPMLGELALQKESEVVEGVLKIDHVQYPLLTYKTDVHG